MYQNLFSHSPIEEYLYCFQFFVFTNLNKASVNTPTVFLCKHKFSFFWPKCPRVKLLGMVTAGLLLREIPCLLALKEKKSFTEV